MEFAAQRSSRAGTKKSRFLSPVLQGALLLGVAVHLAGFLLFRVISNPLPTRDTSGAFLQYVSAGSLAGDAALEEQAQLFDSAPLFVPTQWNAAQRITLVQRDRVGEHFPDFEPKIDLLAALNSSSLPLSDGNIVDVPTDLLASNFWDFFLGFGQSGDSVTPFPQAGHFAEVTVVGEHSAAVRTFESPLNYTDTAAVPEPVTLYFRVSGGGQQIGRPVIAESSGNEVFDRAAQQWLQLPETLRQFPSGYLSITVYP